MTDLCFGPRQSPVVAATWRGTSPICDCCGAVYLSFDLADGGVVRLKLSRAEMANVLETYAHFQANPPEHARCHGCSDQPDRSLGKPTADVSSLLPDASTAENVASLSKSSNAAGAE